MNEKLQSALDAVIQEGTFSLSAVEAVKAMRDENERLTESAAALAGDNERLRAENDRMKEGLRITGDREAAIKIREDAVAKREIEMTKLEGKATQEAAVAAAYRDCFGLVFRNQVIQESTLKNVVIPAANGCSGFTQGVTDTKTVSAS